MKTSTSTLIVFLSGAAIGAAATLLFTTEKGAEARQAIADLFSKEFDKLSHKIDHAIHPGKKEAPAGNKA
ncbi:MAG: YtxH domain-containing protein [Prevotellaceae bacterium]|jgi:gas vesicle protein|nr:YtxH domain-containing protein [Prevotellaceae bacterium]